MLYIKLDGTHALAEILGYLRIHLAGHDPAQDFHLPRC